MDHYVNYKAYQEFDYLLDELGLSRSNIELNIEPENKKSKEFSLNIRQSLHYFNKTTVETKQL